MKKSAYLSYEANFLEEFSEDVIKRCILWSSSSKKFGVQLCESISGIKNKINLIIQEMNMRIERNIPYMSVACFEYVTERTRIFVRDCVELDGKNVILAVDSKLDSFANITHIIDCFQASGNALMEKTNLDNIDVRICFDNYIRDLTIIDILLDIAVFNSYSFLRNMSTAEKKEFSRLKFEFYSNEKMQTVFKDTVDDDLGYYSFAFSCHKESIFDDDSCDYSYEIDIAKYLDIWDKFINTYYCGHKHKELSVEDQIKRRTNEHLPNDYYHEFDKKAAGIYYILRTEEKNIPVKYRDQVCTLFGIDEVTVGQLRTIEANQFDKYVELYKHAGISVFKVVVQD